MANKYDMVRSHIDFVRQSLRETSDDSHFTDEQIYKALVDARAFVLYRRLKKGRELPESQYQTVCMELCLGPVHPCGDCVPDLACETLQTLEELPESLWSGTSDILRVSTLFGVEVQPSSDALRQFRSFRKTGKKSFYYTRTNNTLLVWNVPNNNLRAVQVRAVFMDPVGAAEVSLCPDSSEAECRKTFTTSFNNATYDNIPVYEIVLKMLLRTDQQPEDRTNDGDSSINKAVI